MYVLECMKKKIKIQGKKISLAGAWTHESDYFGHRELKTLVLYALEQGICFEKKPVILNSF